MALSQGLICTERVHLELSEKGGVALSQGLMCTERVHLGLSKVASIEGVSSHQGSCSGIYNY